jgi:hypothetical protein
MPPTVKVLFEAGGWPEAPGAGARLPAGAPEEFADGVAKAAPAGFVGGLADGFVPGGGVAGLVDGREG